MGLKNSLKKITKEVKGITFIEIMVAISILAISMTYLAMDASFTSRMLHALDEKDNMLYAMQESIERYKLDQVAGTKEINGYTIDITTVDSQAEDPNLTSFLKKATFTVHAKDSRLKVDDIVFSTYVYGNNTSVPLAPTNLSAYATMTGIVLNWDAPMFSDSYQIYRSTTGGTNISNYTRIDAGGVTNCIYEDTTALNGVTYYYMVRASNTYGVGAFSNVATSAVEINTVNLTPIADAYTRGGSYADTNYGIVPPDTNNVLKFSYSFLGWTPSSNYYSYLKFDLSSITGDIVSANLQLYGYNSTNNQKITAGVYQVSDDSWTESGITSNQHPVEGDIIGNMTFDGTAGYETLDVKDYCVNELAVNKAASFYISTTSSNVGSIQSREGTYKPILSIVWTPMQPPQAPQNLVALPDNRQAVLSWNAVEGAENYVVKRSTTSGGPYTTVNSSVTTNSFTDTGLTNGTKYYYVVSAKNGTGESSNSNEAIVTPSYTSTVTLNPVADAYIRDGSYETQNYGQLPVLESKNSLIEDEIRETYYKFDMSQYTGEILNAKLRIYGNNIENSNSMQLACYDVANNNWQESTINFANNKPAYINELGSAIFNDIQGYREIDVTNFVKSAMSGDKIVSLATQVKGAGGLVSINSRENSVNKPELVIWKTLLPPLAPTNLDAVPNDNKVTLTWDPMVEVNRYVVKRSTIDGGPFNTILSSNVTTTSFVDSTARNGIMYYYVVSAVNDAGTSSNSEQASAMPNTLSQYTFAAQADARTESFDNTGRYGTVTPLQVANTTNNYNKKSYLRFDFTNYTHNTVASAILRVYGNSTVDGFTVNAYGVSNTPNAYGFSSTTWTEGGINWVNAPTLEEKIGTTTINTTNQYYEIDVTDYVIKQLESYSMVSIGLYTDITSNESARFNSNEAAANKPQLYTNLVKGVPKQPKNLIAVGGNRIVTLNWTASEGAESYRIKRSTSSGGPYKTIQSGVTATTYTNNNLSNGTDYYFVVCATNTNGDSINSNEACAIPSTSGRTQTLMPIDDSYVRNGIYSSYNNGSAANLDTRRSDTPDDGNTMNVYMKFDLSGITSSPTSATLMVTGRNITDRNLITLYIYPVDTDTWDEHTITYNSPTLSVGTSRLGSITAWRQSSTMTLNITNYIKSEWSNNKIAGICIKAYTPNKTASFGSEESATAPLLQVTY